MVKVYLTAPPILASFAIVRCFGLCSILPGLATLQIRRKKTMKNIFVGNLSFGATEDSVRSMFEAYGAVDRVSIVTDRETGQPRGFGFVEMSGDSEGDRAISELNGRELDGRALNVNEARPKTDRGSGGGNRGGGGGQRRDKRW
jgi:RNA recognition motif-containing protein